MKWKDMDGCSEWSRNVLNREALKALAITP